MIYIYKEVTCHFHRNIESAIRFIWLDVLRQAWKEFKRDAIHVEKIVMAPLENDIEEPYTSMYEAIKDSLPDNIATIDKRARVKAIAKTFPLDARAELFRTDPKFMLAKDGPELTYGTQFPDDVTIIFGNEEAARALEIALLNLMKEHDEDKVYELIKAAKQKKIPLIPPSSNMEFKEEEPIT